MTERWAKTIASDRQRNSPYQRLRRRQHERSVCVSYRVLCSGKSSNNHSKVCAPHGSRRSHSCSISCVVQTITHHARIERCFRCLSSGIENAKRRRGQAVGVGQKGQEKLRASHALGVASAGWALMQGVSSLLGGGSSGFNQSRSDELSEGLSP